MKNSFRDIPSYIEESQIMTIEDWIDYCECGAFIDFDGYGHFATEDKISDVEVYPSMVTKKEFEILEGATHIIWHNK